MHTNRLASSPNQGARAECPHCHGSSWFERFDADLVQRCLCGLHQYIERFIDGKLVRVAPQSSFDVLLPSRRTKIYRCFSTIGRCHPKEIMTADIARATGLQNKETAALLIALMTRGLIQRASERRGIVGGSEWVLTPRAQVYFCKPTQVIGYG